MHCSPGILIDRPVTKILAFLGGSLSVSAFRPKYCFVCPLVSSIPEVYCLIVFVYEGISVSIRIWGIESNLVILGNSPNRRWQKKLTLDEHSFQLVDFPTSLSNWDFYNDEQKIHEVYYRYGAVDVKTTSRTQELLQGDGGGPQEAHRLRVRPRLPPSAQELGQEHQDWSQWRSVWAERNFYRVPHTICNFYSCLLDLFTTK